MPYFSGPNGIREVADPGERVMQSFNDSRRKKFLSEYYTTGQTDLGGLARIDPEAAQQIQAQQKEQEYGSALSKLFLAPEAERQGGLAQLIAMNPKRGAEDAKWLDPRLSAASNGMFAQKVGEDGYIYNFMRDGSKVNTGIKADRQMWFRDNPGMSPELVGKDGNVRPVGMNAPQPAPSIPAYDRQATQQEGDAAAAGAADIANKLVAAGVPADQIDTIVQSLLGGNGTPLPQAPAFIPAQAKPAMTMDQVLSNSRAERADARAEQNASMGPIPAGMRLVNGRLERLPGAPTADGAQRPMPVRAMTEDLEIQSALDANAKAGSVLLKHANRLKSGDLQVSPVKAYGGKARELFGQANPNDVNLTELRADMTAIVNESLRLNKGVQTEGDAQRAYNEIMTSNDPRVVGRALERLANFTKMAAEHQARRRSLLYRNYGRGGQPQGQQQEAPPANGGFRILPD